MAEQNREAYEPDLAASLNNLGNLYRATQRMEGADAVYRESLELHRGLAKRNREAYGLEFI